MAFFTQLLVGLTLQIIGYMLMPKPKPPKPPSLEDFKGPTAEAGRPIPVVFGSVTVRGLNNIGDWDKSRVKRKLKGRKK